MRNHVSAVLIALFLISRALADAAPATQPAPTPDPDELNHTGAMVVARYDAILDDKTAAALDGIGTPQPSGCKLYHAALFSASSLRKALIEARTHKGILTSVRDISFAKSKPGDSRLTMGRPFWVELYFQKPTRMEFQTANTGENDAFDAPDGNGVHIVVNHHSLEMKINNEPQRTDPADQAIIYDGHVQPGQALTFVATYTTDSSANYHHLVIYEPFRADGWEQPEIGSGGSGLSGDWWIANGPQKMRMLADVAAVWASHAKHAPNDPPPAYSVVLPNGAGVRLLGFCNPKQFNFCWWDPAGDPIGAPIHLGLQSSNPRRPYTYAIQIHGSTTEPETPVPPARIQPSDGDWQLSFSALPPSHEIKIILGEGPWKQLGELTQDQPLTVDNVTYKITNIGDRWIRDIAVERSVSSNDLIALTLVTSDRKEIGPNFTDRGDRGAVANFKGFELNELKAFHLWLRKGHVVTFRDFALSPNIRPPVSVTRDEVLAAQAAIAATTRP